MLECSQPGVYCTGFCLCRLVSSGWLLVSHILLSQRAEKVIWQFGAYMYKYAYFKGGTQFVRMQEGRKERCYC